MTEQKDAQVVACHRMPRMAVQDSPVQALRLGQAALLVGLNRQIEIGQVHGAARLGQLPRH